MPDHKVKQNWDIFIAMLLIFTAVYVPLRISFYDEATTAYLIFDTVFDIFFVVDIILTFFTAVPIRGGLLETRHKEIAKLYLRLWFWIDLATSMPMQILDVLPIDNYSSETKSLKVLRLLRLPRLWKIAKLVRLLKKRDSQHLKKIAESFNLTPGAQGLIKIILTVFLLNHIFSCLWFMIAKYDDFLPDCWVVR